MNRIHINRWFMGIYRMQVCALEDATEEEILEVCNRENPSGTEAGWTHIERGSDRTAPVRCASHPERIHYLVGC